jgi:hypothetical protein
LDSAFVDRCTFKKEIRNPSNKASYEIVRKVLNEQIKQGLVYCNSLLYHEEATRNQDGMNDTLHVECLDHDDAASSVSQDRASTTDMVYIPDQASANAHWPKHTVTVSIPRLGYST